MTADAWIATGTWVGVGCALFAVWRQNRAAQRLASLQLFLQLYSQYESADMQRKRASLAKALLADDKTLVIDDTVLVFFETLAHMTERKLVDRDLVWTTFSIDVCSYWPAVHHYVEHVREKLHDATLFEEMERLYKSLTHLENWRRGANTTHVGREQTAVKSFLRWETLRADGDRSSQ